MAAYRCDIVETSKGNPVMNPEKKNLKHLESEQNHLYFAVCREMLLCHSRPLSSVMASITSESRQTGRNPIREGSRLFVDMSQYEWSWLGCDGESRSCFDGASAIKTAPMITRTATPISSPRATILRHAWVPMSAA